MDSMTKEELDGIKPLDEKRIKRVSRGSGVHIAEIHFLMAEHKKFGAMVKQVGGMTGMMGNMENVSKIVVQPKTNLNFCLDEKKSSRSLENDEELAKQHGP